MKDIKTKRAAIYARVSTDGQTSDNQLRELQLVAENNGWKIVREFIDQGISGAKGRNQRRQLNALCLAPTRRELDVIMAWSLDRLGRSLQHLVEFLNEIRAKGVDTATPAGKALFQMCGVFAEFERSMIQDRVKAGIDRVRAEGQPWGRRKIEETHPAVCTQILELRRYGLGIGDFLPVTPV